MIVVLFLINLALTMFIYLFIPITFILIGKPISKRKIKIISVVNFLLGLTIITILSDLLGSSDGRSTGGALLWPFIGYGLMCKRLSAENNPPGKKELHDLQLCGDSAPPCASPLVSAPKAKKGHAFNHVWPFFLIIFLLYLCNLGLRSARPNLISNTASNVVEAEPQATVYTVIDAKLVEIPPPSHGSFLLGGEDITRNDLYNINVDGILGYHKYARLEIKMPNQKGDMYCLKFHCPSTGQTYVVFAHSGGSNINANLLCGDYELTYSVGSKWYGTDRLFGPETRYYKYSSMLHFYQEGDKAYGESLALSRNPNEGLEIKEINSSDF